MQATARAQATTCRWRSAAATVPDATWTTRSGDGRYLENATATGTSTRRRQTADGCFRQRRGQTLQGRVLRREGREGDAGKKIGF
ncbi:hypothetical protein SESBI_06364 [Sesbania bispinosa]|nr:hypothetical protein SESBI_06364 [Sesbania bispinosa]